MFRTRIWKQNGDDTEMLRVQAAYPAGPVFRHGQAARIDLLLPFSRRRTTRF
jgi:hypothetical protein